MFGFVFPDAESVVCQLCEPQRHRRSPSRLLRLPMAAAGSQRPCSGWDGDAAEETRGVSVGRPRGDPDSTRTEGELVQSRSEPQWLLPPAGAAEDS